MFFSKAGRPASIAFATSLGALLRRAPPGRGVEAQEAKDSHGDFSHQLRPMKTQESSFPRHGPLCLFTGNAHPQLAKAISQQLGINMRACTVNRFNCGEINVEIAETVHDCDVFVVQPTCNGGLGPQEHLMELLIMLDATRRGAANRITAVIPIFGYARQNSKEKSRVPITAKLVTDLLQVAGAHRVVTVELHAPQIQGFADFPIDNMYAGNLLAAEVEKLMEEKGVNRDDVVVVSPDVGGAKRAAALSKKLCAPLAIFSRQRRRATAKDEVDLVGEVEGKFCVIIDGIADTGDTLCVAANKLKAKGAKSVIGLVVHGVFSDPACDKMNESALELVLVTDTIPMDDKVAKCPKLKVVSIAPMLAEAIQRIHTGESMSAIFER